MNTTKRITTAAIAALAVGGSLFAATPAMAAPAPAAATAESAATGPQTSTRDYSITTSVVQGDEVVVRGTVHSSVVDSVRGAAGLGYGAPVAVGADGSFEIRIPTQRGPQYADYVLQFGRTFGASMIPNAKIGDVYWYAVGA